MSCNCYRIPCNTIISTAVTVITVDGTDNLVIDLPAATYGNFNCYNIIIAQAIPAGATINMPVSFSIGGDTTTVYPFIGVCGNQITATGITTRTCYPVQVVTSATGGVFRSLRKVQCYPTNTLASLPVAAAAAAASVTPTSSTVALSTEPVAVAKTKSVKKEDTTNA